MNDVIALTSIILGIALALFNFWFITKSVFQAFWLVRERERLYKLLLEYFREHHQRDLRPALIGRAVDHWVFTYEALPEHVSTGRISSLTDYRCSINESVKLVLQDIPKAPRKRAPAKRELVPNYGLGQPT